MYPVEKPLGFPWVPCQIQPIFFENIVKLYNISLYKFNCFLCKIYKISEKDINITIRTYPARSQEKEK